MKIFRRSIFWGIAAMLVVPFANTAIAQDQVNAIQLLSQATGLTTRQVTMAMGAQIAFNRYRTSFDRVERQFQNAVGADTYWHLKQHGHLTIQEVNKLTEMAQRRTRQDIANQ